MIYWDEGVTMSRKIGAMKRWAKRIGISFEEYLRKRNAGFKRCTKCKIWKELIEYPKSRDRVDGLNPTCHSCIRKPFRKKYQMSNEGKKRLCERNKRRAGKPGPKHSFQTKKKLRDIMLQQKRFVGEKNPNWKGGVTEENHKERNSDQYKQWRKDVFERDHYTCQKCGDKKGGNLLPHHIKSFAEYPKLRYEVSNGITFCEKCHSTEHDKPLSFRKRIISRRLSLSKNQLKIF
jgi:hypothetical protein